MAERMSMKTANDDSHYDVLREARAFVNGLQVEDEPMPSERQMLARIAAEEEAMCLARIIPALQAASRIIGRANIAPARKAVLIGQIAHAVEHLQENLKRMQQDCCEDDE